MLLSGDNSPNVCPFIMYDCNNDDRRIISRGGTWRNDRQFSTYDNWEVQGSSTTTVRYVIKYLRRRKLETSKMIIHRNTNHNVPFDL